MIITPVELSQIKAQAEREYPGECCGLILERGSERLVLPCRNIMDEKHASDPVGFPRVARNGYYIDPRNLLEASQREREGYRIVVIYHSHIDTGDYFSPMDKEQALQGQATPAYPNARYVVMSVMSGTFATAAAYAWSQEKRDYVEVPLNGPDAARDEAPASGVRSRSVR